MPRNDAAYLLEMLLAAQDAARFATGLTFSQFEKSRLHQYAILKAIEVIGEAAARVSAETKQNQPDVPWSEIVGMRNRLVHGYFEVNLQRVWDTVQNELATLIDQVEQIVPRGDEQ
jgi:uncharacterized protein with HEPN domain